MWAVVSPDGVAPSRMVSVILPLHHKVQKFSSGTDSPGWSRKKGHKTVVVVVVIQRFEMGQMSVEPHLQCFWWEVGGFSQIKGL